MTIHPQLSEFSYGYGVIRETEEYLAGVGLQATPYLPSLKKEKLYGFDALFNKPGKALMLQFKLSDQVSRYRRRHPSHTIPNPLKRPFWRFNINTIDPSGQFATLLAAENSGNEVYYVAPRFNDWPEYADALSKGMVLENSVLLSPKDIDTKAVATPLTDGEHRIIYDDEEDYVCSEPQHLVRHSIHQIGERIAAELPSARPLADTLYKTFLEVCARMKGQDVSEKSLTSFQRQLRIAEDTDEVASARALVAFLWCRGVQIIFATQPKT